MSRFRRPQGLTIWLLLLVLLWTAGCARPAGPQSDDAALHADQNPVPFHEAGATAGQGDSPATEVNGRHRETGLPFHESQNLPAGTLLTVRLKNPVAAENPGANGTFEAVVDDPVVIEGNRLVPRGATVGGRVESARVSTVKRDHGYVRLALDSIDLGGASLPIQTSSLFVRGNAGDAQITRGKVAPGETPNQASAVVIRLEKGRRLTFRLTEPAYVAASQRTRVDH
ncbi:MAG TPA: hypothetical protein VKF84_04160 [Candidatus Sulfotelmatobacter sp.]|nr:hypothetical protein [Candidatus Sulfotelmatobacter sp.]